MQVLVVQKTEQQQTYEINHLSNQGSTRADYKTLIAAAPYYSRRLESITIQL